MTTPQQTAAQREIARNLAEWQASIEARMRKLERAPKLANASMHGSAVAVYDEDLTLRQVIGQQPDGSYTVVDSNAPPPPVPSLPIVEEHAGTLVVTWDGTFVDGVPAPADWDHVEVHVSTVSGYTPTDATEVITIHSLKGGSVTLALDPDVARYIRLQAVNTSKVESAPTAEVEGTPQAPVLTGGTKTYWELEAPLGLTADDDGSLWFDTSHGNLLHRWDGARLEWVAMPIGPAAVTTDKLAPTDAPGAVEVLGGFGALYVRWTGITNPDPVEYEVHVSKNANFTPDYAGGGTGPEFFETFTSDLSRWPASYNGPVVVGGQARLTSSPGNYMGIATGQRFTMDEKAVSAKITPQATPGASQEITFSMQADGQNSFHMFKSGTNTAITCRVRVNGVNSDTTVAVTTNQVWWRMREAAANINFEVSSDNGATWSVLRSAAHGMAASALTSMQIDISCGDYNGASVLPALVTMVDDVAYGSETKSSTLATVTPATGFTIRALPDGTPLVYGNQPYYAKVVAKDADGYGPWSTEGSDMLRQVSSPDIAAEYAYLGTLLVDQLRGGKLTSDIVLGAIIKTAEIGQRAEMGPFGFVTYDSTGAPVIVLPSNADNVASIRADLEARGLTVTGKASFRGTAHEIAPSGGLTLQSSVTAPQAPPSVVVDWPQTPIPLFAAGTGINPADNRGLFWINNGWQICTGGNGGFSIRKFNPDGTFAGEAFGGSGDSWTLRYDNGFMVGDTFWIIQQNIETNSTYIVREQPATGNNTFTYYNRINTSQTPALGWDGANLLIAEFDATNKRFRIQTMNPTTLAVANTVYTAASNGFIGPVTGIIRGNFDLGAPRWGIMIQGSVYCYMFDATGAYLANETFPAKTNSSVGVSWDGTQFWTLTSTGSLTKHAPAQWNDANEPQTWYAAMNWRDADPGGTGLHETDMGPAAPFQMRRRGWLTLTAATIPDDGTTDGADAVSFFVGKVNSSRANLWRQTNPAAGVRSVTYSTFNFATTNPPTANNFPPATPAWIRSSALDGFNLPALEFKGDGTGRMGGVSIEQLMYATRARVQLNGGGLRKGDATGISWDARLMSTANGFGANTAVDGYFDMSMPPNGTVIPGVGGAANQTVANGIIPLNTWHALYYILPIGGGFTSTPANYRIATYTTALTIPPHWVLICYRSGEPRSTAYVWGDGQQIDIWKNLTLVSPWLAYDSATWTPGYKKENGWVTVRGVVKNNPTVPSTIATLPPGYRPGQQFVLAAKSSGTTGATGTANTSVTARINVLTDGTIQAYDNGANVNVFVSLFGLTFPAEG